MIMKVEKLKCDNCHKEVERYHTAPNWLVMNVDDFYILTSLFDKAGNILKPLLTKERLDFCCEQCFLNYFITLMNLKEVKDEQDN